MTYENSRRLSIAARWAAPALILMLAVPAAAQNRYRGQGQGPGAGVCAPAVPLSEAEAASVAFMREEEKLARDVYQLLFEKWGLTTFANIAAAEQRHFEAVGALLARYGIPDPAENLHPGVFSNPELAALYHQLVEKGTRSLADAVEVGILIEKTDIADIEEALPLVSKLDVKRVYANLLDGSLNHLEAFETVLEILGLAAPAAN